MDAAVVQVWILLWHNSTEGYRAELFPTPQGVKSQLCNSRLWSCPPPPGTEQPAWSLATRLVTSLQAGCVMMALLPACLPACLPAPLPPGPGQCAVRRADIDFYAWCWNRGSQTCACLPACVGFICLSPCPLPPQALPKLLSALVDIVYIVHKNQLPMSDLVVGSQTYCCLPTYL